MPLPEFAAKLQEKLNRTWARIGALFCACALAAAGSANAAPALKTDLAVERTVIFKGQTRPLYVLIRFDAPEIDVPASQRPPLNLALVLDRSGSMADKGKIEYLRTAAKMAVASLSPRDAVSVVEFDDRITTMWPASRAGDPSRLEAMIDELSPRGSTNLAGGMQAGIDEAKAGRERLHLSGEALSRVIVLSDGLANTGITDHGEIARLAGQARDSGVRVSTIGLGLDYDEDLMQAIAESGGGKYYYVESPVQLSRIFEQELKSAFATLARDVHLAFHGSGAVQSAELVGFSAAPGRDVSADWPDFFAGETRSVLLRLDVDASELGALDLGRFTVAWHDARSGASGTLDLPVRVEVSGDRAAADNSLNRDVAVEATLAESERALTRNVKLYEAGKAGEAEEQNAAILRELEDKNAVLNDARLTRKIEALNVEQSQMSAAAAPNAPADAKAMYLKATKQRLYQAKSGKRSLYLLQQGDKGFEVEQLQRALAKAGVYRGTISGVYDSATAAAVTSYQRQKGIGPDGIAGASTQQALGLY